MNTYYGKYRGQVEGGQDPLRLGRVQVTVPQVLGEGNRVWAMPCVPWAGPGVGVWAPPPVGAMVWVEFEAGDPDRPIFTGCFWSSSAELPVGPEDGTTKTLKCDGIRLTLDDRPGVGGVLLEVSAPVTPTSMKIRIDSTGIELQSGSASVKLDQLTVSINGDAFKVI